MNGRETGTSPFPDKEKPVAVATDRVTGTSFSVLFRENPASRREISIRSREVPLGLLNTRMESGSLLSDGCVLLESEKDADGNYIGGAGIDGMYSRTSHRYQPVLDSGGNIRAFRDVSEEGVLLAVRQDGKSSVLYRGTRPHCEQILRRKLAMEDFFARRMTDKPGMYYWEEKHDWNWNIPSPPKKEERKIMKSSAKNIKLASYDDIFKTDEEKRDDAREKVREIPLSELHPFKNHPFQVRDDDSMKETAESIKKYGVLVPAIARPRADGGYELIAGHRRRHACELAGKETMPVIVRNLDDDAATIIMVDSNLQRENILPSERAKAYKMKLEALKHQGERTDLTSTQVGQKLKGKYSVEVVAEQAGSSRNQIQRFIRLTELSTELLQMVDDKKIAFSPAVELSYLKPEEQALLLDEIEKQQATPSLSQSQRLKKYSQEGKLDANVMDAIMTEEKQEVEKITLHSDRLKKYFPKSYTPKQMEETIYKLLEQWQRKRQHDLER